MSHNDYSDKNAMRNPNLAVALHYSGRGAPRVVAKGNGLVADNIIATARTHGVPLDEDAALANALARVELGREIPRELYVAVAQVLAFVWAVNKKAESPPPHPVPLPSGEGMKR